MLLAQNNGPSANGTFQFDVGGSAKTVSFDARIQNNGSTRGTIVLSGTDDLGNQDVDGGGDANPGGVQTGFSLTMEIDCLKIDDDGKTAVMAGVVTASTEAGYIGVRTLLVVEDGGEGQKGGPDKFTWGMYRGSSLTWLPSDAELLSDPGVGAPPWLAKDAERELDPDELGIMVGPASGGGGGNVNCNSFGLKAYDLREIAHGAGNLQVKP